MSNSTWNSFMNLYQSVVDEKDRTDTSKLKRANDVLSQKYLPKKIKWYPIYSDRPNAWQADLMFEPYVNSRGERIIQAILCVINVNTKYAFAEAVDYVKNAKATEGRDWRDKSKRVSLSNKDAPKVLRAFKKILAHMDRETETLNRFENFKGSVQFKIDRLYVDEGSEFKGEFTKFCSDEGIRLVIFKPNEGTKRRLAIVERFNRTLRRYMDKQIEMNGKKQIKDLLPAVMNMYNKFSNHRGVSEYFRKDMKKGETWQKSGKEKARFFPAMMHANGVEDDYIQFMINKTRGVEKHYENKIKSLTPGTRVKYYKRSEKFKKQRGSTMSEPITLKGRHKYKHLVNGNIRYGEGASYELEGERQRYLPYELELAQKNKKQKK